MICHSTTSDRLSYPALRMPSRSRLLANTLATVSRSREPTRSRTAEGSVQWPGTAVAGEVDVGDLNAALGQPGPDRPDDRVALVEPGVPNAGHGVQAGELLDEP